MKEKRCHSHRIISRWPCPATASLLQDLREALVTHDRKRAGDKLLLLADLYMNDPQILEPVKTALCFMAHFFGPDMAYETSLAVAQKGSRQGDLAKAALETACWLAKDKNIKEYKILPITPYRFVTELSTRNLFHCSPLYE